MFVFLLVVDVFPFDSAVFVNYDMRIRAQKNWENK